MNKVLFAVSLVLGSLVLKAQSDFRPGYIVKLSKDTLYGEIDYRDNLLLSNACKFRLNNTSQVETFSPSQLNSFRFIDSKYFISREIEGQLYFIEMLFNGKVDIYYLKNLTGTHYYIDKEGMGFNEIPYEEKVIYKGNTPHLYKSKRHIGLLNLYMNDVKGFDKKTAAINQPDHDNLISLANDYHNAIEPTEKHIVYKNTKYSRVYIELLMGWASYSNEVIESNEQTVASSFGAKALIWMPKVNEKIYVGLGLINQRFEGAARYSRLPLTVEYIAPRGKVLPRIYYGVNFYFPNGFHSVSAGIGANINLNEGLAFNVSSEFEFMGATMVILPGNFIAYGFRSSLLAKLGRRAAKKVGE